VQVGEAITTLTTVPGREATIGARFQDCLERSGARPTPWRGLLARNPWFWTRPTDERHPALRHLSAQLLRPQRPQIPADGIVQMDRSARPSARGFGVVLRRVKRHGCSIGVPPTTFLMRAARLAALWRQVAAQGEKAYGCRWRCITARRWRRTRAVHGAARPDRLARGVVSGGADLLDALPFALFRRPGWSRARCRVGAHRLELPSRVGALTGWQSGPSWRRACRRRGRRPRVFS